MNFPENIVSIFIKTNMQNMTISLTESKKSKLILDGKISQDFLHSAKLYKPREESSLAQIPQQTHWLITKIPRVTFQVNDV